jgi:hypothetical protein
VCVKTFFLAICRLHFVPSDSLFLCACIIAILVKQILPVEQLSHILPVAHITLIIGVSVVSSGRQLQNSRVEGIPTSVTLLLEILFAVWAESAEFRQFFVGKEISINDLSPLE